MKTLRPILWFVGGFAGTLAEEVYFNTQTGIGLIAGVIVGELVDYALRMQQDSK